MQCTYLRKIWCNAGIQRALHQGQHLACRTILAMLRVCRASSFDIVLHCTIHRQCIQCKGVGVRQRRRATLHVTASAPMIEGLVCKRLAKLHNSWISNSLTTVLRMAYVTHSLLLLQAYTVHVRLEFLAKRLVVHPSLTIKIKLNLKT